MTEYTLIRSNRKTVALCVRDGLLQVRAPHRAPRSEIDRIVASKEGWIKSKLEESCEVLALRGGFSLGYGDELSFRGGRYPITAREGGRAGFDGESFYMPPGLTPEGIKSAAVQIYRLAARTLLPARAGEYAKRMGVRPAAVKTNGAKTRWGSCSGKNSVNFSWRLVMADDEVIDYVVAHELAHIIEHNHSPRFWAVVEGVIPDYRRRKARLADLQKRLAAESW